MTEFKLPKLSMTMEEAVVVTWLVADGADVSAGEEVVEIETDKAQTVLEAPLSGTLHHRAAAGDAVAVDGLLAVIGDAAAAAPAEVAVNGSVGAPSATPAVAPVPADVAPSPAGAGRASPVARRAMAELGVDPAAVVGTGIRGMITLEDVHRAAGGATPQAQPPASERAAPAALAPDRLRSLVVANLVASWSAIPHIHVSGELDASGLMAALAQRGEAAITATDLLLLAMAHALEEVPTLNGTVDQTGQPQLAKAIDLSVAVDTESGVVAPTLKDVGSRSLAEIAAERARLVSAARALSVEPRDLAGGTCTLSNLGAYPVDFFAPIVTGPQIALVATGRAAARPVVVDGELAVGYRVTVNVAIDHRAADGATGGRFLAAFERSLALLPEFL